jgi:hypothetical protein
MDDFAELGMEAVDAVVDKHFHKLPDKALHSDTYHPRNIARSFSKRRNQNRSSRRSDESESDEEDIKGNRYRDNGPRGRRENDNPPPRRDSFVSWEDDGYTRRSNSPKRYSQGYGQGAYGTSSRPLQSRSFESIPRTEPIPPRQYTRGDPISPDWNPPSQSAPRPRNIPTSIPASIPASAVYGDNRMQRKNVNPPPQDDRDRDRRRRSTDQGSKPPRSTTKSTPEPKKSLLGDRGFQGGALGAIIGGLAAHELVEDDRRHDNSDKITLAVLGALAGAVAGKSMGDRFETENKSMAARRQRGGDTYDREYREDAPYR